MGFGKIGSWIDNKLNSAGSSWKGSTAKKTVDGIMERSKKAAEGVKDQAEGIHGTIRDNVDTNLTSIEKENPDATGFQKFMEIGKRGGFIGIAMGGDKSPGQVADKPPVKQEAPQPKQMELFPQETAVKPEVKTEAKPQVQTRPETKSQEETSGGGFLNKMMDFGKGGGLVGHMKRKGAQSRMEKAESFDDWKKAKTDYNNAGGDVNKLMDAKGEKTKDGGRVLQANDFMQVTFNEIDNEETAANNKDTFVPTNAKPMEQVDGFNIAT